MTLNLDTPRLSLTPLQESDFDLFYQMLTDPFIRKYLCDDEVYGKDIIQNLLDSSLQTFSKDNYGLWLLSEKTSGKRIGFAGLRTFFEEPQPQLIYALWKDYTGKGYAKEASERIIEYSFDQLKYSYLIASCDLPNLASQKVALSLGMKLMKKDEKDGLPTLYYKIENHE